MNYPVTVQCYAGYKGDERPTSFTLQGRQIEVREIVDRWFDPDYNCFKVVGDDGHRYLLRHDLNDHSWHLLEKELDQNG
ncbi:PH domain-containing protein [Geomonas sp.]|uniref:PH domain-containing protein n=1 Tax=Geomonas sp. TaxID=2651584 RepID=UPI002B46BCF9|nr:PH domain-containing protein [Geomonas sp.]HJV34489.1 PH domain-containing protein [Geomonas sp.]